MTPHAREEALRRIQRRRRRKDIGIISLTVLAVFVVVLAVSAAILNYVGG